MVDFNTPNLYNATYGGQGEKVTPGEYIAALNTVGQEVSLPRKFLATPVRIPKKAGIEINLPLESGMTATEIAIESGVKDFPEDRQIYHPNFDRLKMFAIKSTWSQLKLETTAVDIVKRTIINQSDAIKRAENALLVSAVNAVIGESPTAWDVSVETSGKLTYKDLRIAGQTLQDAKHYASAKYPYIVLVNQTEAMDILNDPEIISNQNILQTKSGDIHQYSESNGPLVFSTMSPVPMKVYGVSGLTSNFSAMFSPYSGLAWAELQGWQGIQADKKEDGLQKEFWAYSILSIKALSYEGANSAGETPGVVSIDIVP